MAAEIIIHTIGGNCPVQAEGTVNGEKFYFRARGKAWSLSVGVPPGLERPDDWIITPAWFYQENYGTGPFDAGWMSVLEAQDFIQQAAQRYDKEVTNGRSNAS